jgi:hypothetical protein
VDLWTRLTALGTLLAAVAASFAAYMSWQTVAEMKTQRDDDVKERAAERLRGIYAHLYRLSEAGGSAPQREEAKRQLRAALAVSVEAPLTLSRRLVDPGRGGGDSELVEQALHELDQYILELLPKPRRPSAAAFRWRRSKGT